MYGTCKTNGRGKKCLYFGCKTSQEEKIWGRLELTQTKREGIDMIQLFQNGVQSIKNNEFREQDDPSGLVIIENFSTIRATKNVFKRMIFCYEISYVYMLCGF